MPITKTGKTKNGLQQYRVRVAFTDAIGHHKQIERTAYGKSEALAIERKLQEEVRGGELTARLTLRTLADEFLASRVHDVRETTLDKDRRNLEIILTPEIVNLRLDRLTASALQSWKSDIGSRDLALGTKRNYFKQFSALLNFAVKQEYLPINPLRRIGNFKDPYFEQPEDKLHYYTAEEFLRYADAAREYAAEKHTLTEWGYYVFFMIAFYTGMRKGEINALKWSDVDGDIIHVRRSISQKLKGVDRETPPKNKSSYRDLQAPQPLVEVLEAHKAMQQAAGRWSEDFRVCGGIECLRDSSIANHNSRYAKDAALPRLRIHDFRHTHVSLLTNEGINIQEIARRLGHSKVEVTWNTYAHMYPREEERAVEVLNRVGASKVI